MKSDVKKFSEKYYEEILKLPRKELSKLLYQKQLNVMKNLSSKENSGDENRLLLDEIDTIIKKSNYNDRCYFIPSLYQAVVEHVFWLHETHHKQDIQKGLILAIGNLFLVKYLEETIKQFSESLNSADSVENVVDSLEAVVDKLLLHPNHMNDYLVMLNEVFSGDKLERELYIPQNRVDELKSCGYEKFLKICEDIYQEESYFTILNDYSHETLSSLLTEYLKKEKVKLVSK